MLVVLYIFKSNVKTHIEKEKLLPYDFDDTDSCHDRAVGSLLCFLLGVSHLNHLKIRSNSVVPPNHVISVTLYNVQLSLSLYIL